MTNFRPAFQFYSFASCKFFFLRFLTTTIGIVIAAAITIAPPTHTITAYPHIGITNATPGIHTINVPVLSVSIFT